MVALAAFPLLLALGAPAAAQAARGIDLAYFDGAPEGVAASVQGVLEIVVSRPGKRSRGFRRLPFQPRPDLDAKPEIDCESLVPVPRATREDSPEAYEVCGARLLGWTLGRGRTDADSSRIEFPVTADKIVRDKRWLEILLDPAKDRRAWVLFVPERSGLMRFARLSDWATGGRRALIRAREVKHLVLRVAPSEEKEPISLSLRFGKDDLTVEVRGMQGAWARVELQTDACRRAQDAGDELACPVGWMPWRADDGQPALWPR